MQPWGLAAGAVPLAAARREGRKTTQTPHHGGPPACKDKRMLRLLTAPPDGGSPASLRASKLAGTPPRYYLSNAPEETHLKTLAQVGGSRWRIETEFETEKSDVGLDEYETRTWAGWRHHVALCLLRGAFLLSLQQAWGENDAATHEAASVPGGA